MSKKDISPIRGIIKKLLVEKSFGENQINTILHDCEKEDRDLVEYLIEKNIIKSDLIALEISEHYSIEIFDFSTLDISTLPKIEIPESLIRKHHFLPVDISQKQLTVVAANPFNQKMIEALNFSMGRKIEILVGDYKQILTATEKYLSSDMGMGDFSDAELDDIVLQDSKLKDDFSDNSTDDAPIVKFVNKMLLDAIKIKASDIHFEPYEKFYRIRFRIDGILREIHSPPVTLANRLSARLKVMSNMDIAEKRRPQDGRIKIKISIKQAIDFRVNTLPTLYGEKIVLRILDPSNAQLGIDALGYEEDQRKLYLEALKKPQGMILVTGPTGSGKTVSLYTGLNILNTSELNISTAEDPVEINLPGVNQVNINLKAGMDFATALRSFLRQDPDIIMVGEIRDLETAEIAVKASQTGHMVMSTLHTNSAPETLTRLRNMGVPSFNIATSVNLIIAQRLARRLCPHCKILSDIPKNSLAEMGFLQNELDDLSIYSANNDGCNECTRGYRGRIGVYEVVRITPKIARCIMEDANAHQLAQACRDEGFYDLRRAALLKVKAGLTSLEEVSRITIE